MTVRVAINGFGRIGRTLFRLLLDHPSIEVVAVNDLADTRTMAHLIKYDSIHGVLNGEVSSDDSHLVIDGKKYRYFSKKNIGDLDWKLLEIDVVVESTGKYKTFDEINAHIVSGAKKVILSAPSETDRIKTVVLGVNDHILDGSETIISNASCTTNNAAPMIKVISELCGIEQAYITTVHSYTTDQSLHDQPHKDLRRARAASQSIVPTTTGAAKAITKIFPDPIVSVDILGNSSSCLFDALLTSVIGKMVKVVGWYDNEIGYSSRLIDLILLTVKK